MRVVPETLDDPICERCGGSGWVIEDDGRAGAARPCDCRRRDRVPRLLAEAGIPPRYEACRLENFKIQKLDSLLEAQAVARRYVDDFVSSSTGSFAERGLLLIGNPGSGKTHLAVAILRELIERYSVWGRFADFTALVHQIQSTFDPTSDESKHQVLDPVMSCEVLVLDELGALKPTAWVSDVLYLIINGRYSRRLPTIFTTNYRLEPLRDKQRRDEKLDRGRDSSSPADRMSSTMDLLSSRVPAMIVSRLYEMTRPLVIEAEDYRRGVSAHQGVA
jgi:DNA replication protein DnaC